MIVFRTAMILAAALPLVAAADDALDGPALADERERAAWLRPITVAFSSAAFDDSSGVVTVNPRLVAAFALPREAELRVGAGATRVGRDAVRDDDSTVGASLAMPWRSTRASVGYALHASTAGARHEAQARVRIDPSPSFGAAIALHHRPFVDVVPALAVDDQLFHDAGPGGASDPRAVSGLHVDELRLAAGGSPLRSTYVYAEARNLWIEDANQAWTLSAGVGVNVTRLLALRPLADLTARWDTYVASFDSVADAYYSPSGIVSHTPGAEVRRRFGPFEVGGEGGFTFASDGSRGWLAGALGTLRAGRWSASVRGQVRDDPWRPGYRSRRLWLAVERAM